MLIQSVNLVMPNNPYMCLGHFDWYVLISGNTHELVDNKKMKIMNNFVLSTVVLDNLEPVLGHQGA